MNKAHIGFTSAFAVLVSFNANAAATVGVTAEEASNYAYELGKCAGYWTIINGSSPDNNPYRRKHMELDIIWTLLGKKPVDAMNITYNFGYSSGQVAGFISGMDMPPSDASSLAESQMAQQNCSALLDEDYGPVRS